MQRNSKIRRFFGALLKGREKPESHKIYCHSEDALNAELSHVKHLNQNAPEILSGFLVASITELLRRNLDKKREGIILDVGSGPISLLAHFSRENKNFRLVCIDPLAKEYKEITESRKLHAPPIIEAYAEEIDDIFQGRTFDVVFCTNALDHMRDVNRAFSNMVHVLKDDGFIYLLFNINEKDRMKGEGMHQHNFNIVNGRLIVDDAPILQRIGCDIAEYNRCDYRSPDLYGGEIIERYEAILEKISPDAINI